MKDFKKYIEAQKLIELLNSAPEDDGSWCYQELRDFNETTKEYAEVMLEYVQKSIKEDKKILKVLCVISRFNYLKRKSPEEIIKQLFRYIKNGKEYSEISAKALGEISRFIGEFYLSFEYATELAIKVVSRRLEDSFTEEHLYSIIRNIDYSMDIGFRRE